MENCYVLKLRSVVDNDNLEKLGAIKITAATDSNGYMKCKLNGKNDYHIVKVLNTNETVLSAWEGGTKIDDHTVRINKVIGTNIPRFAMSAVCDVVMEIEGKYDITELYISGIKDIKGGFNTFPSTLESISLIGNSLQIDLSSVSRFTGVKELTLGDNSNTTLTGTLDALKDLTLLESFTCPSSNNSVSGNISVLGALTNLSKINCFGNRNITGTLESFVAAQRTAGRTTESTGIDMGWGLYGVTFNGAAINRTHVATLTWTADTITYDGVTISA